MRTLARSLLRPPSGTSANGITGADLARAIGVEQPAVSAFLSSKQGLSLNTARALCRFAGRPIEEVLEGTGFVPLVAIPGAAPERKPLDEARADLSAAIREATKAGQYELANRLAEELKALNAKSGERERSPSWTTPPEEQKA